MQTIGATEARANFSALLRKAADGKERIVIESRGKPRAAVVPLDDLAAIEGRVEQALRESERRFKDFADASPDWFWEMDENCRFTYLSDRFTDITGLPPESHLGKTREETGVPDVDPKEWRKHLADLAEHRSFRDFHYPRIHSDGRVVNLSICGKAIFDEAGAFRGYRGTGSDIKEQELTAEALRESEARLRANMDHAPMEFFLKDAEGRYVEINRRCEELWGVTNVETKGKLPGDVHPERRTKTMSAHDRAVLESGHVIVEEDEVDHNDGVRVVQIAKFPIRNSAGDVAGLGGIVIDITERKRAEEALRKAHGELELRVAERTAELQEINKALRHEVAERKRAEQELRGSEERFRSIIENSPSVITLRDLEGRFLLVNSRFVDRHQISAADVIGKKPRDIYPREFADIMESLDTEVIASNAVCERNLDLVFTDGSLRSVILTKFPVPDADGRTVGVGTISTDVTEHRRAEEQLRQAHRMEAVGQLTGGVAHDFNNLLAVIMGNAELLGERLGADEESVRAIVRAASRGADLTQRLLAFSRRQPLRPRATDVGELVAGMGELLRRTLGETIEVIIAHAPDASRVHIDPGQLENAVLNLAINARDAMPKGGHLKIAYAQATQGDDYLSTRSEADPENYVVLKISDTGTGMEADVLARAVEPFFTTKDVGDGTGLGLSMVYGFAKQSGGELAILSENERGTTVKLYLPCSRKAVVPGDFAAAPNAKRGHGETVLVVEDDADVRELTRTTLERLGYRVLTAEDAQAGLAALETVPRIDLLFSDVVLPGGTSGPDMAREAKRRFPELKVLFTSGYAESAVHTGTSLSRNADLLTKPFRKGDLAQRVRAALER